MGSIERLVAALLSALHGSIRPPAACRNDWLSTVSLFGAAVAVLPVLAALLVALIRKWTGNRYTAGVLTSFAAIGALCCLAVPWLAFRGVTGVFRQVASGVDAPGLTARDVVSISARSCAISHQRRYLGAGHTVVSALTDPPHDNTVLALRLALLIGAPLLSVLLVALQAQAALRRGPKWPGWLLWLPVLVLAGTTAPFPAGLVGQLWLGFAAVSAVGILVVLLAGAPRWSVINRSAAAADRPLPGPAGQSPPAELPGATRHGATYPQPYRGGYDQPPSVASSGPTVPVADARPVPAAEQGRFARVRALGSGGFGTVWLAVDTHLDRTVAVKFAHVPDEETEQRIRREAKALAAVRHPNCVRIYDIVAEPDGVGLVMEYIEGELLADLVRRAGPLDDVAAARLWLTMAGALQAAHQQGVLHRDVKPSNIIVDTRGAPHLIDFGIARSTGDKTLTGTGMMVGTPDYLAPEIARGAPPTQAADGWQLAATISYALSSNPPRGRRSSVMAAMMAAAQQEPCSRLPTASVHLALLRAALSNDPAQRPSLARVQREIAGWLSRSAGAADGPVAGTRVIVGGSGGERGARATRRRASRSFW